ncbi:hypothetical protein A2907_00835 [Candidatus Azambacteria bacterium RIFCSPLOWO2_01_FULL_37_9]|uniref:Nudix hydrolase domain-containing protein n=1 Tax=Candidatus Azambacteria bacterium RIFCSPLOWO2_01_FULL_37_9 TaxID=1797297 RepID=A0A1F5C821_9BACT|nr:MAG: hypothetical protein A2907_00835 [Candidatus Azambacteria bacterium RIFCSPLOWO2_01_FULL_37_9]
MREKSYGVVPVFKIGDTHLFLVVKGQLSQSWSFPKGHANEGESEMETAQRELEEEKGGYEEKKFV